MDDQDRIHHSDLALDEIRENPAGRDARHLEEEYVVFRNDGDDALDLSGWSVHNEAGDEFVFPADTEIDPGQRVKLHSGPGADTDTEFHWGSDHPVWRNAGDTVVVRDADGVVRLRESYNE